MGQTSKKGRPKGTPGTGKWGTGVKTVIVRIPQKSASNIREIITSFERIVEVMKHKEGKDPQDLLNQIEDSLSWIKNAKMAKLVIRPKRDSHNSYTSHEQTPVIISKDSAEFDFGDRQIAYSIADLKRIVALAEMEEE